jgi:serine/threonine protein kinase
MLRIPDDFAGFTILGELGRGTTGVVYRAEDSRLNRLVALKVPDLRPAAERNQRAERFLRESLILASLMGVPGVKIPALHMVGEHQGQPYYVRELVEGRTLEHLATTGSIEVREGLRLLCEIANLVAWVHGQGLVHRNLSPANVLVAADGSANLIGFGRARRLDRSPLLPPAPVAGLSEIDVRGLQEMLGWLCETLGCPVPKGLNGVRGPGSVASAAEFAEAVAGFLQGPG